MKKLFTLVSLLIAFNSVKAQYHVPCADLFFSEYVSPQGGGTAGNKSVELYNPSGAPINMAGYTLVKANNSCTQVQSFSLPPYNIASHGVYVINNGAGTVDPLVAAASDTTWSNLNFNGNDALFLINPSGDTLDIFGIICSNPTGGWALGSTGSITQFITLVRNPNVNNGDTSWNVVQNQWTIYSANDFTHLGSHTMNPCGGNPQVNFVTPLDTQIESAGVINIPVAITNPNNDTSKVTVIVGIGSATQGSDFTYTSKTLVFLPNSTTPINDTLTIIDDLLVEGNETVTLQFTNPFNTTDTLDKGIDSVYTLTIIDNDTTPEFSFSNPIVVSTNEAGGPTIQLPIHLSHPSSSNQTIDIAIDLAASNASSSDYSFTNQTVTFTPGAQNINIPITIVDDCIQESLDSVVIKLSNPSSGTILGIDSILTLNINDNDTSPNVFFVTPLIQTVNENAGSVSIDIKLSKSYCDTVVVTIDSLASSTVSMGLDVNTITLPDTLIFLPGDTMKTITLTIIDDVLIEPIENIELFLSNTINGNPIIGNAKVNIIDNDGPPTLQFNTSAATYNESAGTINIPVTILNPNANPTTVCVAIISGSGTPGADYNHPYQCITFPANSTIGNHTDTIQILEDLLVEGNETVILALTNKANASGLPNYGVDSILTITITDNDTTPTINFGLPNTITVNENAGTLNVPVKISATNFVGPFTVNISAKSSSTATSGSDYLLANSIFTFASGNINSTIPLSIINDCLPENTESIILHLTSPTNGAMIGADSIYVININPNDTLPTVGLGSANSITFNENAGTVTVPLTLNRLYCDTVKVYYNINGTATNTLDYGSMQQNNAVVMIPPGNLTAFITIQIIDDFLVESTETIHFSFINTVNGNMGAPGYTVNILDNDGITTPTVFFTTPSFSYNENAGAVQVGVSIINPNSTATSIDVSVVGGSAATLGVDFTALANQTLTFPANSTTTQYFNVSIINDLLIEPSETFIFTLSNPTNSALIGTNSTFIGTIIDDDFTSANPILNFSLSNFNINESGGTINLPITISNANVNLPLSFSYVLGGTATNFLDYTVVTNSPATVVGGVTSTNIQVNIIDDITIESAEDITVSLVSNTNCSIGSSSTATIHITDNDVLPPPPVTGINIAEGASAIKVYPNPISATDILKIKGLTNESSFELYNMLGVKVMHTTTSGEVNLNDDLSKGVYFYKLSNQNGLLKEGKILIK